MTADAQFPTVGSALHSRIWPALGNSIWRVEAMLVPTSWVARLVETNRDLLQAFASSAKADSPSPRDASATSGGFSTLSAASSPLLASTARCF